MSGVGPFSRDFDRLEVGAEAITRARTITEADLVSFSALTGDWHPQHSDAAWAARSPFGERIAHGMLVLSYAIGLLPIDPERVTALRAIRQVTFKRPVPIGETIRARARVLEARPLDQAQGRVTLGVQVQGADGRLLARATIDAIWRRLSPADREPRSEAVRGRISDGGAPAAGLEGELSPVGQGSVFL